MQNYFARIPLGRFSIFPPQNYTYRLNRNNNILHSAIDYAHSICMQSPIFFWIAWGIISFWSLKTFYYSFSKEKVERLRKTAFGISLSVFVLSFLPWLPISPSQGMPPSLGGATGLSLALDGNILAVVFLLLLIGSGLLFLSKEAQHLKIGSVATIINTFLVFIIMYQLRPGTFVLTMYDIAPIIAFMILLVGDVAVLLLWQQLQLNKSKQKKKQ